MFIVMYKAKHYFSNQHFDLKSADQIVADRRKFLSKKKKDISCESSPRQQGITMTSSTGISVLILIVTSSVIPSLAGEHRQGDPKETENDIAGYSANSRVKRSIPKIILRLLKTGKVLYASKGYRLIGKRGGYDQAKRDFDNLNPTNVVDFGTSKWGDVGHTTVVVGTDGSKASLMVLKNKSVPDGDVESIVAKISYIDDNFKY